MEQSFQIGRIRQGDTFALGLELSVILNPKISLDLGLEQNIQTQTRLNGRKVSRLYVLPTSFIIRIATLG